MAAKFNIREWTVDVAACELSRDGTTTKLTPRAMAVLAQLATVPGEVVTFDDFLSAHWPRSSAAPNAVHKCVSELRRVFENGGGEVVYIETVPKRGYRLVASVSPVAASMRDPPKQSRIDAPKSLAVLRFRNVDGNPEHGYLATTISTALLEALSRVRDLRVIDRERAFVHSIAKGSVQRIGTDLGVTHVLDGSMQVFDDRIRVTVSLYDVADSEPIYAYTHDEPIERILQVQDKTVTDVLSELAIELDAKKTLEMREWGTRSVKAYLAAAEAEHILRQTELRSMAFAASRLRDAIALDPGFLNAESIDRSRSPRLIDDSNPDLASGAAAIGANGAADRPAQRAAEAGSDADTIAIAQSKSVAVLRFRSIGGNPGDEYLAQALAEVLHEGLSQVSDLSVIERERSFQHSITNETVQGIGKKLGVDHLLDGSVQQLDGRLRVSAALYRRSDGVRLYVYRDEEPAANLRALHDRLIANVLTAMEVHLDERRTDDMRKWGTQNVEAYLAAREADAFHMRLDQKSLQYAVERFRAAIALDPGFVRAYRLLALTLGDIDTFTSGEMRRGVILEELAQIREAVKHLPGNDDALTAVDICERKMNTTSRREREVAVRTAIQEEGTPHRAYSEYLEYADLLKTGHLFREASRYVDLYAKFDREETALYLHRNELAGLTLGPARAIPMAKNVLTMFQNNIGTLFALVTQLALIGKYAEAESYLARLEDNDHVGVWAYALRLRLAALRGDLPARSEQLIAALDDPRVNDYLRGVTHFIVGDVEYGIAAWRRAQGSNSRKAARALIYAVHAESCYTATVVNDPRYQDVLDELGIGGQWTAYLRAKVAELAPITGIEPGDPTPQRVYPR